MALAPFKGAFTYSPSRGLPYEGLHPGLRHRMGEQQFAPLGEWNELSNPKCTVRQEQAELIYKLSLERMNEEGPTAERCSGEAAGKGFPSGSRSYRGM